MFILYRNIYYFNKHNINLKQIKFKIIVVSFIDILKIIVLKLRHDKLVCCAVFVFKTIKYGQNSVELSNLFRLMLSNSIWFMKLASKYLYIF